jgi:hypothetical protein
MGAGSRRSGSRRRRSRSDVWRHKADVREQLFTIGAMQGNQSAAPTADSSRRARRAAAVQRRSAARAPHRNSIARAMADVAEDVLALLPTVWTQEKVIAYAGKDNVVRTVTVLPEMFDGRVQVRPVARLRGRRVAPAAPAARSRSSTRWACGASPGSRSRRSPMLLDQLNYPNWIARRARVASIA